MWILLPAALFLAKRALKGAPVAIVSRSSSLIAGRLTVPLDVTDFATSVALSRLSGIVPQGLLLVASFLLAGSNTPI